MLRSKKCLESLNKFRKKSKRPGNRLFYQYCPGTNYVTSTTQTNLTYFPKPCHLKLCIIKSNFALVENIAKWTGMAASNALVIGKKIFDKMFVIGKSAKPRCFKDVQNLPSIPSPWKTYFEEWLRELNPKFERQGQKNIMIVNNCHAHTEIKGNLSIYSSCHQFLMNA